MSTVRILILDDHLLFRESLARLLDCEPDFTVVGQCSSPAEALDRIGRHNVDLVLLDVDLGNERGGSFAEQAATAGFSGRILAVTAGVSEGEAAQLLVAGVVGIVLKHSAPAFLTDSIRRVMAGEACIDQRSLSAIVRRQMARSELPGRPSLTDREREVLRGVFDGLANKEIGARLGVSESSVKSALQQLFQKAGVRTRGQLVRAALERYRDEINRGADRPDGPEDTAAGMADTIDRPRGT